MKKRVAFPVLIVLLLVFCCPGGGAEQAGETGAAPEMPETGAYSGEALLQDFLNAPDLPGQAEELPEPEDLSFLDDSFLENNADHQEEPEENASGELSSDELNVLAGKQLQDAKADPEKQQPLNMGAFRAENAWTDSCFVYTYPVPEGMVLVQKESVPTSSNRVVHWEYRYSDPGGRNRMDVILYLFNDNHYTKTDLDEIRQIYQQLTGSTSNMMTSQEITGEDGSLQKVITRSLIHIDKEALLINNTYRVTLMYMHDNCSVIRIDYEMDSEPGKIFDPDDLSADPELFMPLISGVVYQVPENRKAAGLPDWLLTEKDFDFQVDAKPETGFLLPGKTVRLNPSYARKDLKKTVKNLAGFSFQAVDADQLKQGKTVPVDASVATLSEEGVLKAGEVSGPTAVTVITTSKDTSESQTRTYVLLPDIQNLEMSERNLTLYTGDSAPVKIQGILTPASAWFNPEDGESNMVWSSGKPEILSVTDNRDTTATLRALGAGKTTVTLKETASNRKVTANVTILEPVTELGIDGPDTLVPGRSAGYKAVIGPKNAGNKKVQWSIDADPGIASIQPGGQLKIGKETPSGTVITLTCTAEGAATPLVATKTVTVE